MHQQQSHGGMGMGGMMHGNGGMMTGGVDHSAAAGMTAIGNSGGPPATDAVPVVPATAQ